MTSALITPQQLNAVLWNGHIKPVDSSWFMNDATRGHKDYLQRRIPRSVYFDIEDIKDHASPYPHMLPSPQEFEKKVGQLALSSHDKIVVYSSEGMLSAARVWWMFRVMGHEKIQALDGGLPRWVAEGYKVISGDEEVMPVRFTAHFNSKLYRSGEEVFANIESKKEQLIDARSEARFNGLEPEPRPGLKSGHIPGALNFPWKNFFEENGRMKPGIAVRDIFVTGGLDLNKPVVASCGSGVSACALALALYEIGKTDVAIYDGSWAEWGSLDGLPVESQPVVAETTLEAPAEAIVAA